MLSILMKQEHKKVIEDWVSCLEDQSIDYQIICSEDGNTDQTPEIIKKLCMNNSRIINNHSKTKRGYTGAVISGVEKSKNEYILCMTQMDSVISRF